MRKASRVMVDKIQALDLNRFRDGLPGGLADGEMAVLVQRLKAVMGML
ncbi:MAG: hypothetical protein RQ826_13045 [Xanthomonadales bacterium]|nr:hypothetical protein [Xanthomonadales bacterium]